MFDLSDVLARAEIDPRDVNVILHSPRDGDLQAMLPGLVSTRPAAMEAYQCYHTGPATRALSQGRPLVASFVKTGSGRMPGTSLMLFAGLYKNPGPRARPRSEIEADAEVMWLHSTFGSFRELRSPDWTEWTWFDLSLDERLEEMRGRLVIEMRLTQAYIRLAENLKAPVAAIHAESAFDAEPPPWRRMRIGAGLLGALPSRWSARLREWRSIYLIVDQTDGARYVGSAYGAENLLGRWRAHVAGEAGVTVGLRDRDPSRFRFSIPQLTSPAAPAEEVIALEQTWMERLDTVRFGLNRPQEAADAA
ncbi:GIY-YIG nuclease family protein [Jannaschia seohaensis]|uniref:GIY-YIG domain-containing protein n=1 Tax=Jannaschia seohaensis TaxID=475081 RepID=A0A2Y9A2W2_9RHOB|nr:GIY-YIG nuclease family protein [Jannaschia seohaensis]PWJ22532.1 hypothetical protein BCF38_101946 [Jannaschia seohaensis]SSA38810.1 hypothetical protein SAMN05421539_101946 [Jannaschia seohaensis]